MAFEYSKEEWMRHAKFEMSFISEQPEIAEFYLKVMDLFTDYPHTADTLYYMPITLGQLFRHENVIRLTQDENEWVQVSDELWRNKRNPHAYSNDAGKTVVKFPSYQPNYEDSTMQPTNFPPEVQELLRSLKDVKNF